ncbi:MAG TPA: MFS transporter [Flexivirga sp.]|uniref:MFS transporter n=1 Tax=Flexivirga sp. TaxID=1962927 RepID=UPI002CF76620|nr:MFS transporter [Flexivirga sp.]HWC22401.1 MFS transporter [Flexivirga sp.]
MNAGIAATTVAHRAVPAPFIWWSAASAISLAGSTAFGFAVTWYATGISAGLTGLVGVLITLPTTALLLVGGAVADRVGVRRILLAGDTVMLLLSLLVVVVTHAVSVQPWLLVLVAVVTGVEEAFYLPASGVVPRLFAIGDALPRATALNSTLTQLARIAGPPCGAIAVAAIAFSGVAAVDGATFVLVLVVLLRIRPPYAPQTGATPGGLEILRPFTTVWRTAQLRGVLVTTAVLASGVLPAVIYGPSLMARESRWGPGASGLIEVGWLVGGIGVTIVVARRGASDRARVAVGVGLSMVAAGLSGMAMAPTPAVAFAAAVVLGVGVSVCTAHLFPAYLAASPMDQLSRYQSLLVFVQMAALLVATVVFTSVAETLGTRWSLGCCAAVMCVALAWWVGSFRRTVERLST